MVNYLIAIFDYHNNIIPLRNKVNCPPIIYCFALRNNILSWRLRWNVKHSSSSSCFRGINKMYLVYLYYFYNTSTIFDIF